MEERFKKNKFDFNDYLESMSQMRKLGGLSSILGMLPGMGAQMKDLDTDAGEKALAKTEAIILSMTPQERANPDLLNPSRKRRIAAGAGIDIGEVNRFIKQFEQTKKMMKQMPGLMGGHGGKRGKFKLPF